MYNQNIFCKKYCAKLHCNHKRIRYDEIVRDDLPIDELFNEAAYKRYIKTAKISDVLGRESILKNLNCTGMSNGKLCFTNAGALFFRANDADVMFRHAGIVCALYKGNDKVYILDAKELNGDIVSNVDDAIILRTAPDISIGRQGEFSCW
ncbi:MAG: hypothetical protein LBJ14_02130 [Desulfarculales bacterium]|jgi:ATP-dependent DNA helicase RecG|nr:hypothetical protein [Desulfarculales bacterium]